VKRLDHLAAKYAAPIFELPEQLPKPGEQDEIYLSKEYHYRQGYVAGMKDGADCVKNDGVLSAGAKARIIRRMKNLY
jgi:hypothetical protein